MESGSTLAMLHQSWQFYRHFLGGHVLKVILTYLSYPIIVLKKNDKMKKLNSTYFDFIFGYVQEWIVPLFRDARSPCVDGKFGLDPIFGQTQMLDNVGRKSQDLMLTNLRFQSQIELNFIMPPSLRLNREVCELFLLTAEPWKGSPVQQEQASC